LGNFTFDDNDVTIFSTVSDGVTLALIADMSGQCIPNEISMSNDPNINSSFGIRDIIAAGCHNYIPTTLVLDTEYTDCTEIDCSGECGGTAQVDECGVCGGGNLTCSGCTDPTAMNYDSTATIDDGSCDLSIYEGIIPDNYSIASIYPNPFNPVTNIIYGLPEHVNVHILVYDLSGKQVETLINKYQTPGYHSVNWNASSYPSGVYLIRMDSGDFTQTHKVVLVK
jgi:hypothetical protein